MSVIEPLAQGPRDPAAGYGPHRTIYLTGIDAIGSAEGLRAQAVHGPPRAGGSWL
jgi:hypothetical protein